MKQTDKQTISLKNIIFDFQCSMNFDKMTCNKLFGLISQLEYQIETIFNLIWSYWAKNKKRLSFFLKFSNLDQCVWG